MADTTTLAEPLGTFVRFAIVTARKDGRSLAVGSGTRSNDEQVRLRREHCGTSQYDIYDKPASQCNPPTARPGTSKHETGEAVDMTGDKAFMARVLAPYKVTRPVTGEDWHFEYTGSNPGADLQALATFMDASGIGYTEADFQEVFGPGSNRPTPQGGATLSVFYKGGSFLVKIGKSVAGFALGPANTAVDAADAAIGTYQTLKAIADRLTDVGWWRRVGIGSAGVALMVAGLIIMGRSLAQPVAVQLLEGKKVNG